MSGKSISRVLNNAFRTVSNVLGYSFEHYRPDSYVTPLQDRNFIGKINVTATPDDAMTKNPLDELERYLLYADSSKFELGDILFNAELDKTYVVTDKSELRAATGVLAQNRFDILRPMTTTGSEIRRTFEELGREIPCALKIVGATSSSGALKFTSSTMSASSHDLELWTYVTPELIQLNDVLQVGLSRYLVTFVQSTAKGTEVKLRSVKVNK